MSHGEWRSPTRYSGRCCSVTNSPGRRTPRLLRKFGKPSFNVPKTNTRCDMRALTFDMSGGTKWAKPALGRPLDGGVRCHVASASAVDSHQSVPRHQAVLSGGVLRLS